MCTLPCRLGAIGLTELIGGDLCLHGWLGWTSPSLLAAAYSCWQPTGT